MIIAFKFPAPRHFGFYDVNALPLLLGSRGSLCGTIGQHIDVINFGGNLEAIIPCLVKFVI